MQLWLGVTVLLGAGFLGVEIYEFYHYVHAYELPLRALHLALPSIRLLEHTGLTSHLDFAGSPL